MPGIYFLLTYHLEDLKNEVTFLGYHFEGKEYVLPDLMYMLIIVWGEFFLLLTYGVISPYAAFAITMNICSHIYIVRAAICRYYYLQFHCIDDIMQVSWDHKHLERICQNVQELIHTILWPGIFMSSLFFSLYLFDMAYDTDHQELGSPLAVMFLTLATVPCTMIIYYHYSEKAERIVTAQASEMELPNVDTSNGMVKNPISGDA